jgi:hypothetical protein
MTIRNLTPHDIVIRYDESNEPIALASDRVIKSSGRAFIQTKSERPIEDIDGIPCTEITYGEISDLPEPNGVDIFIVSMPTAQYLAAAGRVEDIRYPDTGKPEYCVRDAKNQPFATRRLLKAKVK